MSTKMSFQKECEEEKPTQLNIQQNLESLNKYLFTKIVFK